MSFNDYIYWQTLQETGKTPEEIYEYNHPEVVRCKECKHKYQEPWDNGVAVEGECEIWHNATLDDDYCSYGERKESE